MISLSVAKRVRLAVHLLAALVLASACSTSVHTARPELDLKIIHARIVDGTGAPWFRGDVGVVGDHIERIGDLSAVASTVPNWPLRYL